MFAIGNIKPIWRTLYAPPISLSFRLILNLRYPKCFNASLPGCNEVLVESLEFLEITFIMVGMITFGFIGTINASH
jgi:hypothetical protein